MTSQQNPWRVHVHTVLFPLAWMWWLTLNGEIIADSRCSYASREDCKTAVMPLVASLEAELTEECVE